MKHENLQADLVQCSELLEDHKEKMQKLQQKKVSEVILFMMHTYIHT